MKSVVVTGGFGYVGGRIAQKLLTDKYDVRVSSRRNAEQIPEWAKNRIHWGNDLAALCQDADCLVHLAAPNETFAAKNPDRAIRETIDLTQAALDAARQEGVRRFIYFSTVHVYGHLSGTITETTPPQPKHPYAVGHLESEKRVEAAADETMQTVVFRLSNSFGAPADTGAERWSLLVNDLCRQAVCEDSLTLSSSGLQWRDFIPLADVVQATAAMFEAQALTRSFEVLNLSLGKSMTVRQMAERIQARARLLIRPDMPLFVTETDAQPEMPPLVISNQRLLQTGFQLSAKIEPEIDGMLEFCTSTFAAET